VLGRWLRGTAVHLYAKLCAGCVEGSPRVEVATSDREVPGCVLTGVDRDLYTMDTIDLYD